MLLCGISILKVISNGAGRQDVRCWPTTPRRRWTRCWPTTGRRARRTRRRRPPSRARCWPTGRARTRTCSRATRSPRRWWRTARLPTRTRQRPRASAALLSYYTIAQTNGLLLGKLGVTEAASALLSGMQGGFENHQFGSSHASLSLAQPLHWPGD